MFVCVWGGVGAGTEAALPSYSRSRAVRGDSNLRLTRQCDLSNTGSRKKCYRCRRLELRKISTRRPPYRYLIESETGPVFENVRIWLSQVDVLRWAGARFEPTYDRAALF